MITQVLNRPFVLHQLELVQSVLVPPIDGRRAAAMPNLGVSESEQSDAAAFLAEGKKEELGASSGQHGYDEDPDARRGEEPAPIDDTAFFSHN